MTTASNIVEGEVFGGESPTKSLGARIASFKWIGLVLGLTLVAYLGTLGFQFVNDDIDQIVNNPHVQSWQFVPRFFTSHSWSHLSPEWGGVHYRPVLLLWFLINFKLFGIDPFWWHLTTVIVHLAATLAVYLLAKRLVRDSLIAAIAAAVFGLHPIHIEAVAWVSGVSEPLLAVLLISAFLCYLKGRGQAAKPSRIRWLAASLLLYVLSLLTKETAVLLPLLAFAYEWTTREPESEPASFTKRVLPGIAAAVPYVAITVIYLSLRTAVLRGFGALLTPLPVSTILFTAPSVLWFYVKLLVWPVGLSAFYDSQYVTAPGFSNFVLPGLAVIGIAVALWLWTRSSKVVAFACVWLVLPILPVLNLSALMRNEIAHDRYLYLPSVGFSIFVALALARLKVGDAKLFGLPASQFAATIIIIGLLGLGTAWQHSFWENEFLLFQRGVETAPSNVIAANNLGNIYLQNGMNERAADLFRRTLDRNPNSRTANWNLGLAMYELGRYDEARGLLSRAIEIDPAKAVQYVYLGLTEIQTDHVDQGRAMLQRAERIDGHTFRVHYGFGLALKKQGDLRAALGEFRTEAALNPSDYVVRSEIIEVESQIGANAKESRPSR